VKSALVIMSGGFGDALQQIPAVRALALRGGFETLNVLAPRAVIASRCLEGLELQLVDLDYVKGGSNKAYDWVVDLAGVPWSSTLLRRLDRVHDASHDFYTVPTGDGRQNAVWIDGEETPALFPDMSGLGEPEHRDLPAWTMSAQVIALILGERLDDWLTESELYWQSFWGSPIKVNECIPKFASEEYALLLPCGAPEKHAPIDIWSAALTWISPRFPDVRIALGPSEGPSVEAELRDAGYRASFIRASLSDLAAEICRASLVVANDCGPMHLAGVMGAPLLALFGPTNRNSWYPYRYPGSGSVQLGTRRSRYLRPQAHDWQESSGTVIAALEKAIER
jgi:hypothetical protein